MTNTLAADCLTCVFTVSTEFSTKTLTAGLTLKIAFAQVVETSVTSNSPSQDFNHPDGLFQLTYVTPGFKPFSYLGSTILKTYSTKNTFLNTFIC